MHQPGKPVHSDSPWKEVLDEFFPDFREMLFPELFADIDWSRGFPPLDKEFQGQGRARVGAWPGVREAVRAH
ncbi:MAG: hypothetical protein COV99_00625 [Bacteroidetes bacterium CG12_big_fil_rev_8_21_14_0_65_60_17]|nr:MAG: hypothetical protein COV99_00625 [Bacteroidetes bacterium CG12_big_fil_rev_8_21_14_0_65_60_17]